MTMRSIVIIAALIVPSLALAQQPAPQEFTLKLSSAELDIVGKGLGELQLKEAAPVMQKLRQQIVDQQTPTKPQPIIKPQESMPVAPGKKE